MESTLAEKAEATAKKAVAEFLAAQKNEVLIAAEKKSVENGSSTSEATYIRYFAIGLMALAGVVGYDMPDAMQMHLFEIVAAVLGLFGVSFTTSRTSRKNNADRVEVARIEEKIINNKIDTTATVAATVTE